ncbi:hypothetical protein CEXT_43151 [Caerostris extrusa]|uniref:Uncharacterized protein n=1 Tax=Caerostris extrusa TaxID=172846 RepID=A0AAV4Y061_CAEEX|nr:hypothetical protein CEXT_84541 [Caerostris extrusa]GIZ00184.1 hypothetical protein CEXT_43151 [Caerostris extrusa]
MKSKVKPMKKNLGRDRYRDQSQPPVCGEGMGKNLTKCERHLMNSTLLYYASVIWNKSPIAYFLKRFLHLKPVSCLVKWSYEKILNDKILLS